MTTLRQTCSLFPIGLRFSTVSTQDSVEIPGLNQTPPTEIVSDPYHTQHIACQEFFMIPIPAWEPGSSRQKRFATEANYLHICSSYLLLTRNTVHTILLRTRVR